MKPNIKMAIDELHRAFHELNKKFYNDKLPEPAILIQNAGNRKLVAGWCTVNPIWEDTQGGKKYEINIVAEYLNRGTHKVLATLLHEMVHLYCRENDIKEVSRGGAYHNKTFKSLAEGHGLEIIKHDDKVGYSYSKLNMEAFNFIEHQLQIKPEAFTLARQFMMDADGKPKKKKGNSYKYACPCCGTSVRATKHVYIACANPSCDNKGELMVWANREDFETDRKIEITCRECGVVSQVEEETETGLYSCPECGSTEVDIVGKAEP